MIKTKFIILPIIIACSILGVIVHKGGYGYESALQAAILGGIDGLIVGILVALAYKSWKQGNP